MVRSCMRLFSRYRPVTVAGIIYYFDFVINLDGQFAGILHKPCINICGYEVSQTNSTMKSVSLVTLVSPYYFPLLFVSSA